MARRKAVLTILTLAATLAAYAFVPPPADVGATGCSSQCGPNTGICNGLNHDTCKLCQDDAQWPVPCTNKSKKTWNNITTRGSDSGSDKIYFVSVLCYTTWPCETSWPFVNHICDAGMWQANACAPQNIGQSICWNCQLGTADPENVSTCQYDSGCPEG